MTAHDVAADENVSPWDALLLAVRRRATKVRVAEGIVDAAWAEHRVACADDPTHGNPDVPPNEVRVWMAESRNEERLMARSAKMAIDAGVADAMIRRMQLEGRHIVDVLLAGLDELSLSAEDRMRALSAMHRALTAGAEKPSGAIEGIVTGTDDRQEDESE